VAFLYSTQFAAGVLAGGSANVFTVPAGKVLVLRDVSYGVFTGTTAQVAWGISGIGFMGVASGLANNSEYHWTGRAVLVAGQTLVVQCATSTINYVCSGYLLSI